MTETNAKLVIAKLADHLRDMIGVAFLRPDDSYARRIRSSASDAEIFLEDLDPQDPATYASAIRADTRHRMDVTVDGATYSVDVYVERVEVTDTGRVLEAKIHINEGLLRGVEVHESWSDEFETKVIAAVEQKLSEY